MTGRQSSERKFPFVPKSSLDLELGDFWAVRLADGRYGCAVVTDLKRSGVASRKSLVVGLVDWVGAVPPTATEARGRMFDQGLTRIEAIAKTDSEIIGNVTLPADFKFAPMFRDYSVGSSHLVWGWRVLPRLIEQHFGIAGRAQSNPEATTKRRGGW